MHTTQNILRILSLSKNISSIELRTCLEDEEKISQDPELIVCIKTAKDTLLQKLKDNAPS